MSDRTLELEATQDEGRLDRFLAVHVADLSRSAARQLIDAGQVSVGGRVVKASYQVRPGDVVVACLPQPESSHQPLWAARPLGEAIPLAVVYEDGDLLVVDKPAGMVVHPAVGHADGTLVNAVLAHCPGLVASDDERPGIVHRLDRDTSGLIVVAKSDAIRQAMQRQFKERRVRKVYLALLEGHLQPARGRVEAPLGRDPRHRQRVAVLAGGREAITEYRVREHLSRAGGDYTLVEAEPKTGRTHQIRVHLASIGHPVAGDTVYGRRRTALPLARQFLHAWRLGFQHPVTGLPLELEAPLPADLAEVLDFLRVP